ncbi:MAG: hypothetical protein ACLVJ6_12815, partial [Merdibacter sp.]
NQISDRVNKRELDSLLSTGEQRTVTLLAMAIDALGIPAISLTGYQCGFITSHHHAHARIKDINIDNLKRHLDEGKVVVVAGFQGATENGEITTLGRGGSDTTAVALAAKLGWECHIYTDVNGVYTIDPRLYRHARLLKEITYNEMMQMACLGAGVLETQRRAGPNTMSRCFWDVRWKKTRAGGHGLWNRRDILRICRSPASASRKTMRSCGSMICRPTACSSESCFS